MAYQYPKRHETFEGQGRPKGSRTKNSELRELIRDFSLDKFVDYVEAFEKIDDPKDKAKEYREMLKYVVPTITAIQFEQEGAVSSAQEHLRALTGWGWKDSEAKPQSAGTTDAKGSPEGKSPSIKKTKKKKK